MKPFVPLLVTLASLLFCTRLDESRALSKVEYQIISDYWKDLVVQSGIKEFAVVDSTVGLSHIAEIQKQLGRIHNDRRIGVSGHLFSEYTKLNASTSSIDAKFEIGIPLRLVNSKDMASLRIRGDQQVFHRFSRVAISTPDSTAMFYGEANYSSASNGYVVFMRRMNNTWGLIAVSTIWTQPSNKL